MMADSDFDDDLWNDAGNGQVAPFAKREDSVDSFDWPDDEDSVPSGNVLAGKLFEHL